MAQERLADQKESNSLWNSKFVRFAAILVAAGIGIGVIANL